MHKVNKETMKLLIDSMPDETAQYFSMLSGFYLRDGEDVDVEVYCPYGKKWQESRITDFYVAKVVKLGYDD